MNNRAERIDSIVSLPVSSVPDERIADERTGRVSVSNQ